MTIQLKIDAATGKKDIVITLRGDDDALPHEHEQQHKALVERLIGGGLLAASEVGKIVVERLSDETEGTPLSQPAQEERHSESQGN